MIKVTIDTHVLIGGLDGADHEKMIFDKLVSLHRNGTVDVAISNRLEQDKANDVIPDRKVHHMLAAKQFTEISSPFRMTLVQEHGFLVVKSTAECLAHIFSVSMGSGKKNTTWDTDHLYGHLASKRDYFLTTENRILNKRPFLKRIRINVAHPNRFIQSFEEIERLSISDEVEFQNKLATLINDLHPDTTDPNFRKRMNKAIDHFLALEAADLKQMDFHRQAEDPSTEIGQVIATIAKWLDKNSFAGGFTLFVAKKEYPRMKKQYEAEGAIYGNDHLGLIAWIDKLYESNIW